MDFSSPPADAALRPRLILSVLVSSAPRRPSYVARVRACRARQEPLGSSLLEVGGASSGSFVDVVPGVSGGLRSSIRGSRDGGLLGLGGDTILGSGSESPAFAMERGRASALFRDEPTGPGDDRGPLSPLTFQADQGSTLRTRRPVSLDGRPSEPPQGPANKMKTFPLFKFDPDYVSMGSSGLTRAEDDTSRWGVFSPQDFCGGVIARGGRFCTKEECAVQSHRTKAWLGDKMLAGFYVLDAKQQKAFLEPFLPMSVGMRTSTARSVLSEGEQTVEAWAAIFRHLRDSDVKDSDPPVRGDQSANSDGTSGGDSLLRSFATAMKTPGGRRDEFNPLATASKRLRLSNIGEEDSLQSSSPEAPGLTALAYALAIVKGELGSKDGVTNYNTVHGGIRAVAEGLGALETEHLRVAEDQRQMREDYKRMAEELFKVGTETSGIGAQLAQLQTTSAAAWNKGSEAMRAVEQLATVGGASKVALLEAELAAMTRKVADMGATLDRAAAYALDLGEHVASLPTGGSDSTALAREFLAFKEANAQTIASIRQELKGGAIEIAGIAFEGQEACILFAREHMTREATYQCIPSLIYAMCMPTEEVVYKSDMQGDEIHQSRTTRNPMQSAVILSVNSTIPAVMEGPKDGIRESRHDFNAAKTYEDWKPATSMGGTAKNLTDGVLRAFDRIKGAINLTLGTPLVRAVMLELHGEFVMHFRAIFVTEVTDYYQEILGKTGGPPPHDKEIKATCWALVTKLLKVIFQEVHKVRVFAADLGNLKDDTGRVNGLFLYAALEELRVLRDFAAHQYRHHPKYNNQVVEHLFNTSVPRAVYEKGVGSGSSGGSILRFNKIDGTLADHKAGIDRLETAVGSIRSHLQLPAAGAARNRGGRRGGGGGAGAGGVQDIE
ncbi:hypothetical protein ACHAW5_003819 [Stephanodiscus triporus]|uniref:Exocyst complex component Sec10 n=1 Tax=Stephanodiscus triporus TaxID=2934178 RepID=A0ABD3R073_9STRA